MENEKKNKLIIRIVIFVIIILLLILIGIVVYNNNKSNRIEEKLKKDNYEEITDKIYSKDIVNDNSQINYVYNLVNNEITKTITNKEALENENINMLYNNNLIKINYYYTDGNGCRIMQTGSYKNNNFKCDISSKSGNCDIRCDVMLKEVKTFSKEINKW